MPGSHKNSSPPRPKKNKVKIMAAKSEGVRARRTVRAGRDHTRSPRSRPRSTVPIKVATSDPEKTTAHTHPKYQGFVGSKNKKTSAPTPAKLPAARPARAVNN